MTKTFQQILTESRRAALAAGRMVPEPPLVRREGGRVFFESKEGPQPKIVVDENGDTIEDGDLVDPGYWARLEDALKSYKLVTDTDDTDLPDPFDE